MKPCRLPLLNNRSLQASFEEIGAAEADLVQAGLFTNPSLDAFLAFPLSRSEQRGRCSDFFRYLDHTRAKSRAATQTEAAMQTGRARIGVHGHGSGHGL